LLGHIVAGPLHEAESANELVDLAARPGSRDLEFTVRRKLVENPITHYTDLPDEQAAWLRQRARSESRLLERCFGLVTESRLEGVAVTDPDGRLTDVDFPGQSSLARIALLSLPELLATAPADDCGWVTVTWDRIHLVCEEIVHSYPKAWAKDTVEDISKLVDRLLWHLRALGLVRAGDGGTWLLSPAAHRWVPRPDDTPRTRAEPTQEPEDTWSLFDAYELEAQWARRQRKHGGGCTGAASSTCGNTPQRSSTSRAVVRSSKAPTVPANRAPWSYCCRCASTAISARSAPRASTPSVCVG